MWHKGGGLTILDFCAGCGQLLSEGQGHEDAPTCSACRTSVKEQEARIQGRFCSAEALCLVKLIT